MSAVGNQMDQAMRHSRWVRLLSWVTLIVSVKFFLAILYQYRWYFPPDFDASPFLSGRRFTFVGLYRLAFYCHIAVGPTALVLGTWLLWSGQRPRLVKYHRMAGKGLAVLIGLVLVPSGLVMSMQAYGGMISVIGFIVQSLLTGLTVAIAAIMAKDRRFESHRRWATRCYLLLWSPLLLRFIAGWLIVFRWESEWTYQINAWASWLVPLLIYEMMIRSRGGSLISRLFETYRHQRGALQ